MQLRESKLLTLVLSFGLSLIVSVLMLRGGYVMGGGESGVQFANLPSMKQSCSNAWADVILGLNYTSVTSSCPYYYLLGSLAEGNISGYMLQVSVHVVCIFTALIGCIALFKTLKPKTTVHITLLSAIFYITNPYAIVNVWNRFLPNVVVFYCVLPLLIYFAIKYINEFKLKYLFSFTIISAFSAYGFTGPAQTLLFWSLVLLFITFTSNVGIFTTIIRFAFLAVFWIGGNFWWIYSQYSFATSEYFLVNTQDFFTNSGNIDTLVSISERLGKISELLLLRHSTFFENAKLLPFSWPAIFNLLPVKFIYITILLTGIYVIIKKHRKLEILAGVLLIIGISLTKGTNPPFGIIFGYIFSKVSLLQFFRNPVEKLGIITSIGWSIILLLVLSYFYKANKTIGKIFVLIILTVQLAPFVSGLIYTSPYPPGNTFEVRNQVNIPKYYSDINKVIDTSKNDSRILVIPQGNEGITYNWTKGYNGVEQSAILFNKPSLSYSTSIPYFSNISKVIEYQSLFFGNFTALSKAFGIEYLVFRPDIYATSSGIRDPEVTLGHIYRNSSLMSDISEIGTYGPLKLFKVNNQYSGRLFLTSDFIKTNKPDDLQIFSTFYKNPYTITIPNSIPIENANSEVIQNRAIFMNQSSEVRKSEDVRFFPHVQTSPSSKKYVFIRLKEVLSGINKLRSNDKAEYELMLLGKRVKEISLLKANSDEKLVKSLLDNYTTSLDGVFNIITSVPHGTEEPIWHRQELSEAIMGHIYYLEGYKEIYTNLSSEINEAINKIESIGVRYKIINSNIGKKYNGLKDYVTYQFETQSDNEYEVIIPQTRLFPKDFEIPNSVDIYINTNITTAYPKVTSKGVSLGKFMLNKGMNEITLNTLSTKNYLNIFNERLETNDSSAKRSYGPYIVDNHLKYKLSMSIVPFIGQGLWVNILENNTPTSFDSGDFLYPLNKNIGFDGYSYLPRKFDAVYTPSSNSDFIKINFELPLWNNCKESYINDKKKCLDQNIYKTFNRKSELIIQQASLTALMPEKAYLYRENDKAVVIENKTPYVRHSSVAYETHIESSNTYRILAQLDTFDSGWKAKLNNQELDKSRHILVDGYANGWIIFPGESGEVNIFFDPNDKLSLGYKLSASILISVFILIVIKYIRNRYK